MPRIEPVDRVEASGRARELLDVADMIAGIHPSTTARSAA